MRVAVKLIGILHDAAPPDGHVELGDGDTARQIIELLGIDPKLVKAMLINSVPEQDLSRSLQADDQVTLIPPIGGP